MPMGCCSACHRHVMASEAVCPFCRAAVKTCASSGVVAAHTLLGASLVAGTSLLSACVFNTNPPPIPPYGVPSPPFVTPSPTAAPSASPAPSQLPQ